MEMRYNGNGPHISSVTDWSVCVYPARRERKKIARNALESFGLPTLEKWLANHDVQNPIGGVRCLIIFVPLEGYVYLREPLNGFELRPEIPKSVGKIQLSSFSR